MTQIQITEDKSYGFSERARRLSLWFDANTADILEERDFEPTYIRLSRQEAIKLRNALNEFINKKL